MDRASLLSVGAAVGSILVAIALGLAFSALNPTPPTLGAGSSSSPSARPSTGATASPKLSGSGAGTASAAATPKPIATITFGAALNTATREVTSPTTTFGPTGYFAHSISSTQPFGVSSLVEEVVRVANGKETVVQSRTDPRSVIPAKADGKVVGFIVTTRSLLDEWGGGGTFILRVYRGNVKLGEGRFTLSAT